jgi:iron donor protein CyaY
MRPIIQTMALSESEFRKRCDEAFDTLNRALGVVAEQYDVEILFQSNVLSIEIEEPNPGKIVISPQAPTRQIWISAQSTSFKLDWSDSAFVFPATGETLSQLVGRLIGQQLDVDPIRL